MQIKKGLSGSTLKIIAMISMLTDHAALALLGSILRNNEIYSTADHSWEYISKLIESGSIGYVYLAYVILRNIIGRLAFPIFCFLLVEGFTKTSNKAKYAERLLLFAVISEIPFNLVFSFGSITCPSHQNTLFTLFLGFMMLWGMEEAEKRCAKMWVQWVLKAVLFFTAVILAEAVVRCDYGAYGIFAIAALYWFRWKKSEQLLAGCVAFLWELPATLAFIPIAFYNGKRGLKLKYIFYIFYPAHLLVVYLLTYFLL